MTSGPIEIMAAKEAAKTKARGVVREKGAEDATRIGATVAEVPPITAASRTTITIGVGERQRPSHGQN